jgi:hypothetical protein
VYSRELKRLPSNGDGQYSRNPGRVKFAFADSRDGERHPSLDRRAAITAALLTQARLASS